MESRSLLATALVIAICSSISSKILFSCNGERHNAKCLPGDQEALLDLKTGLIDPHNTLLSWRGTDCCSWRGIECDNITGSVTIVDLSNRYPFGNRSLSLSGHIRPSLMHLKSLKHLDLSFNKFQGIPIPEFFASLKNLTYLNLSNAGFSGTVPRNLGNLSNLQYLDISISDVIIQRLVVRDFRWITGLVSLKHLMMNSVDLSSVDSNWLQMLNMLPHLTELHLSTCRLSGSISNLHRVNFTSLAVLDLSFNGFASGFPDWLVNVSSLVYVDLSYCSFRGRIPLGLGELPNLQYLNLDSNNNLSASATSLLRGSWPSIELLSLAYNRIHGKLPANIGNMSSLTAFHMTNNYIEGAIPNTIGSLCKLVNFDVSGNRMTGSLPELLQGTESCLSHSPFPLLETLIVRDNRFNGSLPNWLGSLQKLVVLDVSSNYLTGRASEAHFSKLKMMKFLILGSNSIIFDVDPDWLPPFQVRYLDMGSVRLGPSFPRWLQSQLEIQYLDISNSSISGSIPVWFWDLSFNLSVLNVSHNQLQGRLPRSFKVTPSTYLDFSFNLFEGFIPLPSVPIIVLDLSNNRFYGPIPWNITEVMPDLFFLSLSANQLTGQIPDNIGNMYSLYVLDLSRNNLTGSIPSSIGKCSGLNVLDLGNNNLSGEIPSSIGQLKQLQSLHLNDNSISGKLPSSLQNLSFLETIDLGNNMLEGTLPPWLGEGFISLRIINLRANTFSGGILFDFSNLTSLQVLDLSRNNLTGRIPTSLGDLKAMAEEQMLNKYLWYGTSDAPYYESLVRNLKSQQQKFTKTLSLVTAIDLSGNSLSGEFPFELTKLHGLVVLNLSRNHISGRIPENISSLRQLQSLDLSSNDLSGNIPRSMAMLSFLGYLNLSNNNLSGEIPNGGHMLTFDSSSFEGNRGLCGAPLVVSCRGENKGEGEGQRNDGEKRNDDKFIDEWFYLSIGLGFAAGILGPYIVLIISKAMCDKYFDFLDKLIFKVCW